MLRPQAKKQKDKDLQEINGLINNLSKITNHKIKISQQNENMYVVIANQKEIKDLIREIGLKRLEFDPKRIPIITQLPKDIHCMAMTSMSSEPNSAISSAMVIIRSELPEIMRRACFHEEIAQSLGLTNDSHVARPSIFNDDDEFATLTKFDEILLQHKILFYFTPLIAAMAGNVGVQSSAIIVQGLANDEIKGSINNRLFKETLLSILNGVILAGLLFLFIYFWKGEIDIALALSIALVAVVIVAGIIGTFIPLFLNKRGIDPAIATGPFITTSNDIFGILIYFMVAKLILQI